MQQLTDFQKSSKGWRGYDPPHSQNVKCDPKKFFDEKYS